MLVDFRPALRTEVAIARTEFQVSASAPSFRDGFAQMIDNLYEEADLLFERIEEGAAAPNEQEASRLAHRVTHILEIEEEASSRGGREGACLAPPVAAWRHSRRGPRRGRKAVADPTKKAADFRRALARLTGDEGRRGKHVTRFSIGVKRTSMPRRDSRPRASS